MRRVLTITLYVVLVLVAFWAGVLTPHREPARPRPLPASRPAWEREGEAWQAASVNPYTIFRTFKFNEMNKIGTASQCLSGRGPRGTSHLHQVHPGPRAAPQFV